MFINLHVHIFVEIDMGLLTNMLQYFSKKMTPLLWVLGGQGNKLALQLNFFCKSGSVFGFNHLGGDIFKGKIAGPGKKKHLQNRENAFSKKK